MLRSTRLAGALAATVLACAACGVGATVAPPAPLNYGAVTTIGGGGNSPNTTTPPGLGGAQGMARFGNMLYFGTSNGIVIARNIDTGEQTLYAGSQSGSGYGGDGDLATGPNARLLNVGLMAVDSAGNLYAYEIGDPGDGLHCNIRRIDATTHIITTWAGGDIDPAQACHDDIGDGGNADLAGINTMYAMAFDSHDNLFIASNDDVIRRIDHATHVIDTYTGALNEGGYIDTVDPQTPRDARWGATTGFAFDATDHMYITDDNNAAIRMIDTGSPSPVVTTVAGGTVNGSLGNGYVDGPVTEAQIYPGGGGGALALSPTTGELYISDGNESRHIRSLSADRTEVTTIAGDGAQPGGGSGPDGIDYVGPALDAAVNSPLLMTFDAAGGLDFVGNNDGQLRYVDTGGIISNRAATPPQPGPPPFTGDGGPATDALVHQPMDLLRLGSSLYVAEAGHNDDGQVGDPGNRIRKIDIGTGLISTVAGTGERGSGGDGGAATAAQLTGPQSLAGNAHELFVSGADARVRRVDLATGIITTVTGNGTGGFSGDGGPAVSAQIGAQAGLASASGGRLLIGDVANNRIRCIGCVAAHPTWITTIAGTGVAGHSPAATLAAHAKVSTPYHIVIAPDNTIVFSEVTSGLVRRINANGTLSTVAGSANPGFTTGGDNGPATSAKIAGPMGLRYDAAGNLDIAEAGGNPFIGDFAHPAIRQVNGTTGIITTIAGNGSPGFSGDGGSAKLASFYFPISIAPDDGTHLYIADMLNNRVRRIRGIRPDLVTTMALGTYKAGTSGMLTINEQSANSGWVSGPVKAVITLPTRLTYQSAAGIGWTCRASGHTVTCTHLRGIAPRTTTAVTLQLGVTAGAAATVSVHAATTSNSDVTDASHQATTRSIHIVP